VLVCRPSKPRVNPTRIRPTDRLFDIAAALLCEKGYAATTTREIAAVAGIRQASLYYHVDGKEDLLHQISMSSLEQLFTNVQSAVSAVSDPPERIGALVRTHLGTILQHKIRHVTMLKELRALSDPHRAAVMALRKEYANLVRSVIEGAQTAGAVRVDIPARYLYLALLNILNWAVLWFRRGQTLSEDQLARIFTSLSHRCRSRIRTSAHCSAGSAQPPKENASGGRPGGKIPALYFRASA